MKMSPSEIEKYITMIAHRFINIPRMHLFFDSSKSDFYIKIKTLISYCFHLALKADGVFITKNGKAIVLYYEKKNLYHAFSDLRRLFEVAKSIGWNKLPAVMKNEKLVTSNRQPLSNFLYVWFLAQDERYNDLDGLIEIKNHLFSIAKEKKLPILLETTSEKLLPLYARAGFKVYHSLEIPMHHEISKTTNIQPSYETIYYLSNIEAENAQDKKIFHTAIHSFKTK